MRFIANGPSIPDELLSARDQGRVVFFCGAGVSRAKAQLPDFFGLAKTVTKNLGVSEDDPANKIITEAKKIGDRTGVDGLISADRIFGLLERDFQTNDIESEVSKALALPSMPNLSAHQTLLKLATTREGLVRLVTTNFDRLFDLCRPELPTFVPPDLPNPQRATNFHGIVYLHGKNNGNDDGAEGDGFVLSSSDFGRAYLSDGWATTFFKEILERYFVVFVGYSADDPPVQYLLEALNKTDGRIDGVYAFQSGDENYANSKWQHKGVAAIPYDDTNAHSALWDTLDAWAARAVDPDEWTRSVVELAKPGPESLRPHERGQVAHIVSTVEGLRRYSDGNNPPPATWLCVFDPYRRYAKPGHQGSLSEQGPYIDPFDLYSLDSDPVPNKIDPEDQYESREVPNGVWDAFALNSLDRVGLRDENISPLKGHWSNHSPRLPARLSQLGTWISKVAAQPEAIWWAARQSSLHVDIQNQITWQLERNESKTSPTVHQAWRYLFDYWSEDRGEFHRGWYELGSEIDKNGWDEIILRRFASYSKPYLKVKENYWNGPMPSDDAEQRTRNFVDLDVEYSDPPNNFVIPEEWLERAVVVIRRNLEVALELETEIGGYGLSNISPIIPDDNPDVDSYSRNHGLSAWVHYFTRQIERLMSEDLDSAQDELRRWSTSDSSIFARLRIWAMGQADLVDSGQFTTIAAQLPEEAFWDSYHARDLLLTISTRWSELEANDRKEIEQRILEGPNRWDSEEDEQYRERKAWASVNRLNWLDEQGCFLQLNLDQVTEELRKNAPKWKSEYAKSAAESLEGRSGMVRTETEHSTLLDERLETTLETAEELSGRQGLEFVEYDPFAGLSQEHPVRAFSVLRLESKRGKFPEWAWRAFLNPDRRKDDRARFTGFIAEQLSRYSAAELVNIIRPATDWLQKSAKTLSSEYPEIFSRLVIKLIDTLSLDTTESSTAIVRGSKETDWTMEAINSPTGRLAEALFDDPQKDSLSEDTGFPKAWLRYVERLLALPGDLRRHTLVILAHNLSWFFYVDPKWTTAELLAVLNSKNELDQEALWAGFLWGGNSHGHKFFEILKPHMLRLATSESLERRGHTEAFTGLLLSAWSLVDDNTSSKWVSDEELRRMLLGSNDDVRSHVLWHAERWAKEKPEKWYPLLRDLIRDVWPRQIAAKSGVVSARLCDIAFSDEQRFPELAKAVLPLLTKIDRDHLMLPNLRRSRDNIVDLHPHETLALLHAVLPDNVAAWPYGIDSTIERIGEADSSLKGDERLIELKRLWDSR